MSGKPGMVPHPPCPHCGAKQSGVTGVTAALPDGNGWMLICKRCGKLREWRVKKDG